MALYEVLLVVDGTTEVRLTDEALRVGHDLEIGCETWQVVGVAKPRSRDAVVRFVCKKRADEAAPLLRAAPAR